MGLSEKLQWIADSFPFLVPEFILISGLLLLILSGLIIRKNSEIFSLITISIFVTAAVITVIHWPTRPVELFHGTMRADDFSSYLKLLFLTGGILTVLMTRFEREKFRSEYFVLLSTIVLGSHLLVMSMNFVTLLISLELISIGSYLLVGFGFTRQGSEGSLKYFLFGSTATAVMIYGMSLFYGLAGTLDFSSNAFVEKLIEAPSPLFFIAGCMVLAGFLFKISAAPFHLWAPDVYQSAPVSVVAFLSVVPKLAGIGALVKFILAINLFGQSTFDWQVIIAFIALLSITVGNFSALWQDDAKRMMAYSSIAQSGFLLIGVAAFTNEGLHFLLFYASIFLAMNFLVFFILQQFETRFGITSISGLAGLGKKVLLPAVLILIGLISLTGLPPTGGFIAKLFIFTALWDSYTQTGKSIVLVLFLAGLVNTVVALFFYLKIPYYLFIKSGVSSPASALKTPLLSLILQLFLAAIVLLVFFQPDLLMGWINRINFVL
jgi:NADH-quinone oxidoreductase subunit N